MSSPMSLPGPLPSETSPHILVVDDDTRLRKLLKKFLSENGFRVTLAADATEARARMDGLVFDLTVLDVMMPGETGIELAGALRQQAAARNNGPFAMPILLLSARSETVSRIAGLEAGADDYLGKPFEPKELLLRIQALLRRAQAAPGKPARPLRIGPWLADLERGELRSVERTVLLTSGELALLRLLAAKPGTPISRAELCQRTNAGQERTVDVQITRLRRKFEDDARAPRHLQTVRGQGYVLWTG